MVSSFFIALLSVPYLYLCRIISHCRYLHCSRRSALFRSSSFLWRLFFWLLNGKKILIKYIYQWRKEWENIQNTLQCLKLDFEINKKIDFILLFNYDWNKRVYLPWFLIYPHLLFCLHLESLPLKETIKIVSLHYSFINVFLLYTLV